MPISKNYIQTTSLLCRQLAAFHARTESFFMLLQDSMRDPESHSETVATCIDYLDELDILRNSLSFWLMHHPSISSDPSPTTQNTALGIHPIPHPNN